MRAVLRDLGVREGDMVGQVPWDPGPMEGEIMGSVPGCR